MQIHIFAQRLVLCMNLQNVFSTLNIRSSDRDLTIKSSRTKNCRVKNIHTVRCCHYNNSFIDRETIHLYQHLIQCLLSLIMTTAKSGTSSTCYGINLVNKYNTWCILLRLSKQISYTGSTDSDKHFHKIRTGNGKKRYMCFAGNRFGKQSLTGSRRTNQQNSFWDSCTQLNILIRTLQEIYNLFQILFFFFQTCHFIKCDLIVTIIRHLRTALTKVHHGTATAAGILHTCEHHNNDDHGNQT